MEQGCRASGGQFLLEPKQENLIREWATGGGVGSRRITHTSVAERASKEFGFTVSAVLVRKTLKRPPRTEPPRQASTNATVNTAKLPSALCGKCATMLQPPGAKFCYNCGEKFAPATTVFEYKESMR